MEIKTIDEYILMEMGEGSKVYIPVGECKTCEEYIVKKLLKMEERVYNLEEENETLKSENKVLRESLKNCGKKITQVAKALEDGLESRLNNGLEAPAISVKIDFDDFDYLDDLIYEDDGDLDASIFDDRYNCGDSNCKDEED